MTGLSKKYYGFLFFVFGFLLVWSPNSEPDMYSYRLYRSSGDTSGFELLSEIKHPDTFFFDGTTIPVIKYFYYLTAVDSSLNESFPSDTVSGVDSATSLVEPKDKHGDSVLIFPNPSGIGFTIKTNIIKYSLVIYNIEGKKILEHSNLTGNTKVLMPSNTSTQIIFIKINGSIFKHVMLR